MCAAKLKTDVLCKYSSTSSNNKVVLKMFFLSVNSFAGCTHTLGERLQFDIQWLFIIFIFFLPWSDRGVDLVVQKLSSRQWQIGDEERREAGGTPLLEKPEVCERDFLHDIVAMWREIEIPVIKDVTLQAFYRSCIMCCFLHCVQGVNIVSIVITNVITANNQNNIDQ